MSSYGLLFQERLPRVLRWYGIFSRKQARRRVRILNRKVRRLLKRWKAVPATHSQLPKHGFREGYQVKNALYRRILNLEKRRRLIRRRWKL